MFFPEGQVRIFVYGEPVNMRLSYDGLYAKIRNVMGKDPMSGHLFAFINRRATQMKVMYWDRSGFCIWSKRLEEGRLISDWSTVHTREMDCAFPRPNWTLSPRQTDHPVHAKLIG